jgi:hypothetical protein
MIGTRRYRSQHESANFAAERLVATIDKRQSPAICPDGCVVSSRVVTQGLLRDWVAAESGKPGCGSSRQTRRGSSDRAASWKAFALPVGRV